MIDVEDEVGLVKGQYGIRGTDVVTLQHTFLFSLRTVYYRNNYHSTKSKWAFSR